MLRLLPQSHKCTPYPVSTVGIKLQHFLLTFSWFEQVGFWCIGSFHFNSTHPCGKFKGGYAHFNIHIFHFELIDLDLWNAFCEVSPWGSFLITLQRQKKVCTPGDEAIMKIHKKLFSGIPFMHASKAILNLPTSSLHLCSPFQQNCKVKIHHQFTSFPKQLGQDSPPRK